MKKIVLVICYYGVFPPNFEAWVLSAGANKTIDYLVITDIHYAHKMPLNIRFLNWSFAKLASYIQEKFDFQIALQQPYKLCDFKPAYGYIFKDYLSDYDFWGHCDLDQIFGNIRNFLTNEVLETNEVIGYLGHFIIYRNSPKMNELFRAKGGLYDYQKVFSTKETYAFDEVTGMKQIVKKNNITHFYPGVYGDMRISINRFWLGNKLSYIRNYDPQIFYWDEGQLFQAYIENEKVKVKEFMYIHFSKKKPVLNFTATENVPSFYLKANKMESRSSGIPTITEIIECAEKKSKLEKLEKLFYYLKKMFSFFKCSKNQKRIWMAQKKFNRISLQNKR